MHNRPCHASHSCGQFWHRKALHFAFLKLVSQPPQAMADVGHTRLAGPCSVVVLPFLSEEIKDPNSPGTAPNPEFSGLRVSRVSIVPKIFCHRRPAFAQSQGESAVKVVVGSYAVSDRLCLCQQNIAGDFMNRFVQP